MRVIEPDFLENRVVVFVVDTSHSISAKKYTTKGVVVSVDKEGRHATVSFFYHGRKSALEEIPFSQILGVADNQDGSFLEIDGFTGKGHDLRNMEPFGTYQIAS